MFERKKWTIKFTFDYSIIPLLDIFPKEIIRNVVKTVFMKMLRVSSYKYTIEKYWSSLIMSTNGVAK